MLESVDKPSVTCLTCYGWFALGRTNYKLYLHSIHGGKSPQNPLPGLLSSIHFFWENLTPYWPPLSTGDFHLTSYWPSHFNSHPHASFTRDPILFIIPASSPQPMRGLIDNLPPAHIFHDLYRK